MLETYLRAGDSRNGNCDVCWSQHLDGPRHNPAATLEFCPLQVDSLIGELEHTRKKEHAEPEAAWYLSSMQLELDHFKVTRLYSGRPVLDTPTPAPKMGRMLEKRIQWSSFAALAFSRENQEN